MRFPSLKKDLSNIKENENGNILHNRIEKCSARLYYYQIDTTRWRRKAKEGRINDHVVDWLKDIEKKGIKCKCV